jgi:hypothetical protein
MKQSFAVELETEKQMGDEELAAVIRRGLSTNENVTNVKVVLQPQRLAHVAYSPGFNGPMPPVPGRGPGGKKLRES